MKTRKGFVSNSSSSSFVVKKKDLTKKQIKKIKAHKVKGPKYGFQLYSDWDEWTITETDKLIKGNTGMDNFDMYGFMEAIGVDMRVVERDEERW